MKARDARIKTVENQLDAEAAIEQIKNQAGTGQSYIIFNYTELKDSATYKLIELGYKISKVTDPTLDVQFYKVEW